MRATSDNPMPLPGSVEPGQQVHMAEDAAGPQVHHQALVLLAGDGVQISRHQFGDLFQRDHGHLAFHIARLHAGKVQQLLDQAGAALRGLAHFHELRLQFRHVFGVQGVLGLNRQHGQWCAQLVSGVAEEISLVLQDGFQERVLLIEGNDQGANFNRNLLFAKRAEVGGVALPQGMRYRRNRLQGVDVAVAARHADRPGAGLLIQAGKKATPTWSPEIMPLLVISKSPCVHS